MEKGKIGTLIPSQFEEATLRTAKGPIDGVNQLVLWTGCENAQWKLKGGDWITIAREGQMKLKTGEMLYLFNGVVKELV
ncbi:hypothetical protein CDV31_013463 [Fusarium ambrosium]|uniref:Uncharacterized protein n=1 Tax=Fusarium ambrosium TaxID=131363 RepID=A0A428T2X7_9HYPO|nr:hypothetical protein CDV31_013463 [Fusarium ambrosium]